MARERFGRAVASQKPDASVVTDADHAVQQLILDHIAREFPRDAVISEETQSRPQRHASRATAGRCWVVDPIDGTRNYARWYPSFAVCLGLLDAGRPVVGFIYDPQGDEMYSAAAGCGAWMNQTRLRAVDHGLSSETILAIPSSRRDLLAGTVHRWIDQLVVRNAGSTALHLAYLARGALDAVYCDDCKLWDIAAGAIIASEAGAQLSDFSGGEYFPFQVEGYVCQQMPFLAAGPNTLNDLLREYQEQAAPKGADC